MRGTMKVGELFDTRNGWCKMEDELYHFTEDGVPYHCWYVWYEIRVWYNSTLWLQFKVPGSEKVCRCANRQELDRSTLLETMEV